MRLAGKVAIISGAASGMGAATARMFAREGAKVVIADVLEHEGRQVADAIGASARFEPLDVTKEESWAAIVAATTRHFGKLDVLVNNAGISGSDRRRGTGHPAGDGVLPQLKTDRRYATVAGTTARDPKPSLKRQTRRPNR
jgi:NAD(P)-dependent dehydrogenase (short-subunit alcohol dehydrogenase family)